MADDLAAVREDIRQLALLLQQPRPIVPPGQGVDALGGPVVDPTKNVLDLVVAAVKRVDDLLAAFLQRQDDMRTALDKRFTEMNAQRDQFDARLQNQRDAYEGRLDVLRTNHQLQLENVKSDFGKQIASILAQQTEKSATLLSAQVSATTERLAVVEKNQYVAGGQTAVRDPFVTDTLKALSDSIDKLSKSERTGAGEKQGQAQIGTIIVAVAMGLVAVGTLAVQFTFHH